MKIVFNVDYRTNWGESLYVVGGPARLGSWNPDAAKPMTLSGDEHWSAEIDVPSNARDFEYSYIVKHENGSVKHEWGKPHVWQRPVSGTDIDIYDRWQDQPWDKPYYSSAIVDCICHRENRHSPIAPEAGMVTLRVSAPMVKADEELAVCGSSAALGMWDPAKAIRLNDACFPEWTVNIPAKDFAAGTEYKFMLVNKESGELIAWELGENRRLESVPRADRVMVFSGMRLRNPKAPWRGAGLAIPVFSVRTEDDFGVGDFYDLKKIVDWLELTGQNFLQLLPINDTTMTGTWQDSYPYNANSTFALHPMYMRLEALGELADESRREYYRHLGRELNALKQIDYERVTKAKYDYIREIFAQEGKKTLATADFKRFVKDNAGWLPNYAAFCVLRDKFHTADFSQWGEYAVYDKKTVDKFLADNADEVNLVYYTQYHLSKQMTEVRDYAHSKNVAIKGDIPIGISRNSVDAWADTRLFNMDSQAGAPPDDFSVLGQVWGFPTYNWEEMNKDGFAWWKARFSKMAQYFDAYRIDHVLGFFRIFQIPMDAVHGLLGVFNPALPFTPDELRYNYDFWLDVDLQTTPYIMDYFLHDFFGEYTDEARGRFLDDAGYGRYRLKPGFNTQRKVADYFSAQEKNDKNQKLCDALMGLIDQVLFIEDPYEKGKYHPRISAQFTYVYRSLNDYERWCFDRLYNDFFYRRHNDFWYGKAMWKLPPLIDATDMLCCAEDLGMIPDCVPAVMKALEMLSLEIQTMPKDPRAEFGDTWHYPYFSVCTTSTHDMGGIRVWWEGDHEKSQHFFNNMLHESGQAPFFAEPWICEKIVDLHLKSPSMLCILPLADILATSGELRRNNPNDEIINVPANSRHYWRYRIHLNVEDLIAAKDFNDHYRELVRESGR